MNRTLTALGTSVLLGGSLLLGTAPAHAVEMPPCPPKTHLVMDPGSTDTGECVHDPQPAPTAPIACSADGTTCIWGGTPRYANDPAPQAPPAQNPPPRAQAPANPAPVQAASRSGAPVPDVYRAGQVPAVAVAGTGQAPAGETLQSQAPVEGQVPVQSQTSAKAAHAAAMPVTEVQAVDALRSATATPAQKKAALVIVKARIEAVLTEALDTALAHR